MAEGIAVFFVMFLLGGVVSGFCILRYTNIDSTDVETKLTGLIPAKKLTPPSKKGYFWLWLVSSLAMAIIMWTMWLLS